MSLIRSGYDFANDYQVLLNGNPDTITGWTFKASLIGDDGTELIADTACAVVSEPLAQFRVEFSAAQTAALLPGNAIIEVAAIVSTKRYPLPSIPVTIEARRVLS
jgi:hypothetical protein